LRDLGLSGIAAILNTRVMEAQSSQQPFLETLAGMLQDELDRRHSRLTERRFKRPFQRPPHRRPALLGPRPAPGVRRVRKESAVVAISDHLCAFSKVDLKFVDQAGAA
jgi:hypothetical protein